MLRSWRRDERGVAAVEFALTVPIMILLYCGMAELTMAMMAERQAAHSASVVGDLVAQTTQIKVSEVNDVFTVGSSILKPFPSATLQLRVTSIKADAQNVPRVVWSMGQGMGPLTSGAAVTGLPANLIAVNESVIRADMSYTYTSPLMQVLPNPMTFSNSFYLKPRRSPEVTLVAG